MGTQRELPLLTFGGEKKKEPSKKGKKAARSVQKMIVCAKEYRKGGSEQNSPEGGGFVGKEGKKGSHAAAWSKREEVIVGGFEIFIIGKKERP